MTPDVNVLVAAFRADHPHHAVASNWLTEARTACAAGQAPLRILPMVLAGFLRLVTHPQVFAEPDTIDSALDFAERLLESPGVDMTPVGNEWPLLREKLRASALSGNRIPDAWIAACVEQAGDHLVTFDRGFRSLMRPKALTVLG